MVWGVNFPISFQIYRNMTFRPLNSMLLVLQNVAVGPSSTRASLVVQLVKNLPAMQETWVWSLGWEDPLRRESLLTPVFWPGEFHVPYSSRGHKESDTTEWLSLFHRSLLSKEWDLGLQFYFKWQDCVLLISVGHWLAWAELPARA